MGDVCSTGLDLTNTVFQAHAAGHDGSVMFRHKLALATAEVLSSAVTLRGGDGSVCEFASLGSGHRQSQSRGAADPACLTEAVREVAKNDMAEAEAIAEAASRPTMRFVAVKSEAQQAAMA